MTGTSFIPIIVAIIVVAKNKKIINRFKNTDTTTADTAKTLEELNIKRRLIFNKLFNRSILIKTKKRMILIPVIVFLLILLIFMDVFLTK